jgi:hypothetical protein
MSQRADVLALRPAGNNSAQSEVARKPIRAEYGCLPRAFPIAMESPSLPGRIRDEILEFYAFVFCQRGFRQLGMTFEQFLLVVATIGPHGLQTGYRTASGG